jgi:hypothetical protein
MTPPVQDSVSPTDAAALRRYHDNPFDLTPVESGIRLPLADEPFVSTWEDWWSETLEMAPGGVFATLAARLPQLAFPIAEGMSTTEGYQAATRRGVPPDDLPEATGLDLPAPEAVELHLHQSAAGRVPLLISRHRETFVALVQALARRNEPKPIPPSMGALMVAGYNNWARIHGHRQRWEATPEGERARATWGEEFAHIRPQKALYQDRFILLSDGPYSGVAAAEVGLEDDRWRRASLVLRRDHECTHYLTRRLLGSMRNNVLDELLADYAGMHAVPAEAGGPGFRAAWFLRFLGLEHYPEYRPGARLDIYRGDPSLSDAAFRALHHQIHAVALHLERFDQDRKDGPPSPHRTACTLLGLASLRFDEMAARDGATRIERAVEWARGRVEWCADPLP